ncbi:YidB family protein [Methylobacterium sp. E-016]|uniref:YidB family protein n=1 Tax=Methylobacterium sp. E-016 TaxID=2836556 RepID=UPI001FB95CD2|nr:YidB family protein [Methylobacterium sp. E-016]MCJ2077856.1 YidB family protein [Methylobacterium sp. E-016]
MSDGFPSMTALLGLLAVAGFQNRDKIQEMLGGAGHGGPTTPGAPAGQGGIAGQGGLGGLLVNLGGALGGSGAGGLLSGGLGQLVDHFRENGHGEAADSWVNHGPNVEMKPDHLRSAIGSDVLDTLSRQTGLSHDDLLSRLSRELPSAVDRYTPDGRLPFSVAGMPV